jgi:hypothetical protein
MSSTILTINDETLSVEYDYDKGEPMVWRYKDGSGHPGSPASVATSRVVLLRPIAPFHAAMKKFADAGPGERSKAYGELMSLYQCVDLTNLTENLFGYEPLDERVMTEVEEREREHEEQRCQFESERLEKEMKYDPD